MSAFGTDRLPRFVDPLPRASTPLVNRSRLPRLRRRSQPAPYVRGNAREKLRVLVACDHLGHGGTLHGGGRQLVELARSLAESPVEATVCVLRPGGRLGERLRAEGLPFHFLGDSRFQPTTAWKLARIVRRRRIQVLHLTDFGACTHGRLAGIATRTPSIVQVITHHSEHQPRGFPPYVRLAYRLLAPATAKVLAISPSVADFAASRMGFRRDRIEVLYYPLPRHSFREATRSEAADARRQLGLAESTPIVGAVTRFHPVKGIDHLLRAFELVRGEVPAARLVLVGEGPEEQRLRALAAELGLGGSVVFAGPKRRVEPYLSTFWVAVVPSLEEGFGLVAVEALSLGVPVVASRVGGLPDVVEHEVSGLVVEPANPEAIASAVLRLLRQPELRNGFGREGRRSVERFSLDRYCSRLIDVYREVARGGR